MIPSPNCYLILLFLLFTHSLIGQEEISNSWTVITQKIDAQKYQGKAFKLIAATKMKADPSKGAKTQFWARVDKLDGKMGFFENMSDRAITNVDWVIDSIQGRIDDEAEWLLFGGLVFQNGEFFFDDFQLSVESEPGVWEKISLENAGFESGMEDKMPKGWGGSVQRVREFSCEVVVSDSAYEGNKVLKVTGQGIPEKLIFRPKEYPEKYESMSRFSRKIISKGIKGNRARLSAYIKSPLGAENQLRSQLFLLGKNEAGETVAAEYNFDLIRDPGWKLTSMEAELEGIVDTFEIGFISGGYGELLVDEFSLEIRDENNQWVPLEVPNGGFERTNQKGSKPEGWDGPVFSSAYYSCRVDDKETYRGQAAIQVKSRLPNPYRKLAALEKKLQRAGPLPKEITTPFDYLYLSEAISKKNQVFDIVQDDVGFIWIATADGLARYDGTHFKFYYINELTGKTACSNYIYRIFKVPGNQLWLGTDCGLVILDLSTEKLYKDPHLDNLLPKYGPDHLAVDDDGEIWISSYNEGIIKYNPSTKETNIIQIALSNGKGGFNYFDGPLERIHYLGDDQLVLNLSFSHSPFLINKNDLTHDRIPYSNMASPISFLTKGKDGDFWYGTDVVGDGLGKFNLEKGTFANYRENGFIQLEYGSSEYPVPYVRPPAYIDLEANLSHNQVMDVLYTSDDRLLAATKKGINLFIPEQSKFVQIKHRSSHPQSSMGDLINSLYEDKDNNIWVGTDAGIRIQWKYKNPFLFHEIELPKEFYGHRPASIWGVEPYPDNQLLLWNETDIYLYDPAKRETRSIRQNNPDFSFLKDYMTYFVKAGKNNTLWIGTGVMDGPGNYVTFHYDIDKGELIKEYQPRRDLPLYYTTAVEETENGTVWVGTTGGIARLDLETGTSNVFSISSSGISGPSGPVSCLFLDRENSLWIGTENGLNKYDNEQKQFKVYKHNSNDSLSLSANDVLSIKEDKQGRLWIGTKYGLNLFHPESETFERFFIQKGSGSANYFQDIVPDKEGHFWILGSNGLLKFDPGTGQFSIFNENEGLGNLTGSGYRDEEGRIYFGGATGLVYFDPQKINVSNPNVPEIVLTDFFLSDQLILPNGEDGLLDQHISYAKKIKLKHWQDVFTIKFAALDFTNPSQNQYAYKLAGFDDDWQLVGNKNEATYTNLNPGKYTFVVKGSNNSGVWNEEGTRLAITILPPWYWAWWSKALYLMALMSGLYALYLWRTREQREKLVMQEQALAQEQLLNARLQQIDKLKDQFLANTTHELKTPLHGIIGLAESMFDSIKKRSAEDIQNNLGMILTSGRRLASLVNDLLDFSRAKNKDIQLQTKSLNLNVIADVVIHSSEPLIGQAPVELKSEIPKDLPPVLADPNRLQQILYNLIGNAIKFTREGSVVVKAREVDGEIEVCVEDTGIGIPKEKQDVIFQSFEQAEGDTAREFGGTGLGLSITKQLVELHGGRIWVESHPDRPSTDGSSGSHFYFTLPVSDQPTQLDVEMPKVVAVAGAAAASSSFKAPIPIAGSAGDRIKILVVDDEPINHQVLKNYLSEDQYLITSVMSGQEAMEAIDLGVKFDLVLLDVMMPRMSGYEVCEKIRKKHLASELPIIMVTAKNQIQDLVEGLSVGANDYLAKPFSKDEFMARIKTQLDLHRIFDVAAKFVPNEFINTLGRDRITEVMNDDHTEKEVTIFYSDIRSYTTLSEQMTPTENYKFISSFNLRLGPIIRENHGFVNRYLGDGFLAIFQKGSATALEAAINIQKEINLYNEERRKEERKPIRVGIGFHTGPLIMGIIGDQVRMDTAIVSDTVNTAARIEGLTKYYGANILFSGDSLLKMGNASADEVRYMGQVVVKGKNEPLSIYECFAGDPLPIREKKWECMEWFKEGLNQYFGREFTDAASTFKKILNKNPEDRPARLFLSKAAGYIASGVAEEWTGVEVMEVK